MCEYTRPGSVMVRFKIFAFTKMGALLLGLESRERQPLLALHLLPMKNHSGIGTVPLDRGNLDIVLAPDHSRALRIT